MKNKMKNKRKIWLVIGAIVLVIAAIILILRCSEDTWIKDKSGVYVKHGNPSNASEDVLAQQEAIRCATAHYAESKFIELSSSSECLGTCGDYAVDLVNVPRTNEDNAAANQCPDYVNGKVKHFIELNTQTGEVVRVV